MLENCKNMTKNDEKRMTLEFPIQVKERHFFGGIPDRGNKYYIPSNRNSQSTQQKFGEQGIPKTFDTLMSKN